MTAKNVIKIQVEDEGEVEEKAADTKKITSVKKKIVKKAVKKNSAKRSKSTMTTELKPKEKKVKKTTTKKTVVKKTVEEKVTEPELLDRSLVEKVINEEKEIDKKEYPRTGSVGNSPEKIEEDDPFAGRGGSVQTLVDETLKKDVGGEFAQDEKRADVKVGGSRVIKIYSKIAYFFILLTIALVAVILYFTFVRVTIVLIPNQERIHNNMIFDIYDSGAEGNISGNALDGVVELVAVKHEKTFPSSGIEVIGKEAVGKIIIVNNYTKNQPLVATTRLLAPDGKLFRLKNTINVPAGGSLDAEIYADEPSAEMAIKPTKFSIPGLWAGLQDKIYAESKEAVVYRQKVKKHVTEADLENGVANLKSELLDQAKFEINDKYKDYSQINHKIDENSITSNIEVKAGDEMEEFIITMEADVVVVAFDKAEAAKIAKQKFIASLSTNKEVISFDEGNIIYALNNFDPEQGVATVNATFVGKVSLKDDSNIIELENILGLNNKQLDTYLSDLNEIAGFEVKYYPSFIKRVPNLPDKIKIEIKK